MNRHNIMILDSYVVTYIVTDRVWGAEFHQRHSQALQAPQTSTSG